jgi:hypothetical protein
MLYGISYEKEFKGNTFHTRISDSLMGTTFSDSEFTNVDAKSGIAALMINMENVIF